MKYLILLQVAILSLLGMASAMTLTFFSQWDDCLLGHADDVSSPSPLTDTLFDS